MKPFPTLAALALAGCAATADQPAWQGTMDTLPGGIIVVTNPAAGLWDSASAWKLTEEIVIGPEVDSIYGLSEITGIAVDSTGRIYILERSLPAVLIYDSMGKLLKRVGREGDGPGEFRQPNGLGLDQAGRLWVVEGRSQRYSIFDREGNFLATKPRRIGSYGYFWSGKFLTAGDFVEEQSYLRGDGHTTPVLTRYDSATVRLDSLVLPYTLTGENNYRLDHANGYTVMPVPWHPSYWNYVDARGFVWTGNTGRYELTQLDLRGDTIRVIRKEQAGIPVTAAERDSAIDHVKKIAQGAEFDEGRIPRVKPVLERVLVDDAGFVYVLTPEPEGATTGTGFDVFDPEGRYLGRVTTPRRIGPWRPAAPMVLKRGKVWAVVVDEDDVPRVVRWGAGGASR